MKSKTTIFLILLSLGVAWAYNGFGQHNNLSLKANKSLVPSYEDFTKTHKLKAAKKPSSKIKSTQKNKKLKIANAKNQIVDDHPRAKEIKSQVHTFAHEVISETERFRFPSGAVVAEHEAEDGTFYVNKRSETGDHLMFKYDVDGNLQAEVIDSRGYHFSRHYSENGKVNRLYYYSAPDTVNIEYTAEGNFSEIHVYSSENRNKEWVYHKYTLTYSRTGKISRVSERVTTSSTGDEYIPPLVEQFTANYNSNGSLLGVKETVKELNNSQNH